MKERRKKIIRLAFYVHFVLLKYTIYVMIELQFEKKNKMTFIPRLSLLFKLK